MKLADIKAVLLRHATAHSSTPERREALATELADLMLYLIRLADRHGVDLVEASQQKLETDAARRPKLIKS
jgi:NTP pyrophosphatase (non-canonical NTP hydrolase)